MNKSRLAAVLVLGLVPGLGCDSSTTSNRGKEPARDPLVEPPVVTDPACAAKVKDLEPWLVDLTVEVASHEVDFGQVLHKIDRTPRPVPQYLDLALIKEKTLQAFDSAHSNFAEHTLADNATQAELEAQVAKMFADKKNAERNEKWPDDMIRIDVDHRARWKDVVRLFDAAKKAGYTRAVFGFSGTSKLAQPAGTEPVTKTYAEIDKASARRREMQETCKAWDRAVMRHTWLPDGEANARASAKELAAALAECNCAVDPDEVRRVLWTDGHWVQATPRVPFYAKLTGEGAKEIAVPGATPWSEAHAQLLAAGDDVVVTLVSTKK